MKLRIQGNSVRLRLSDEEVQRVAIGESIVERTPLSGGALVYRLEIGGVEISARFDIVVGIEIVVPERQAAEWAASGEVSLHRSIDVDGETLHVLIEKDLRGDRGQRSRSAG